MRGSKGGSWRIRMYRTSIAAHPTNTHYPTLPAIMSPPNRHGRDASSEGRLANAGEEEPRQADLYRIVARLGTIWATPRLPTTVNIAFSSRLTKSFGRADVRRRRISLAAQLAGTDAFVEEVLCHELAHIVAFDLVGKSEYPHGPTWQRLVRAAGFAPTRRLSGPAPSDDALPRIQRKRFVHRCSVCSFSRIASRRMPGWRCADCVRAGLDGLLDATEVAGHE